MGVSPGTQRNSLVYLRYVLIMLSTMLLLCSDKYFLSVKQSVRMLDLISSLLN